MSQKSEILGLNKQFKGANLEERLALIVSLSGQAVFVSQFDMADQVLTWAIVDAGLPVRMAKPSSHMLSNAAKSTHSITSDRYDIDFEGFDSALRDADGVVTSKLGGTDFIAWDDNHQRFIFNPLADWSEQQVFDKAMAHEIPVQLPFENVAAIHANDLRASSDRVIASAA